MPVAVAVAVAVAVTVAVAVAAAAAAVVISPFADLTADGTTDLPTQKSFSSSSFFFCTGRPPLLAHLTCPRPEADHLLLPFKLKL